MNNITYPLKNIQTAKIFAQEFASTLKNNFFPALLLSGNLGSGKTTFTKFLVHELLEAQDKHIEISSPSFTLCNIYSCKDFCIHHYDLYRLGVHIFLEELTESLEQENVLTVIEWPEYLHLMNYPDDGILMQLDFDARTNIRYVHLIALDIYGNHFLEQLCINHKDFRKE